MSDLNWKELGKKLLSSGVPLLGTLVGGPAGAAIGSAGALIASVLGEDTASNPAAMIAMLNSKPELVVELQKLEIQHKETLQQLVLQSEQMHINDVQDARDRETKQTQTTGKRDTNLYLLAWTVVLGFLATIVVLAMIEKPFVNNQAGLLLVGALAAGFGSVLNYFFGSSDGSKAKTAMLSSIIEANRDKV